MKKLSLFAMSSAILAMTVTGLSAQQARLPVHDAETRLEWHQQHLKMRAESPVKSAKWKFIGPELMGGRVTDIAGHPDRPHTYYVASASGGLWKTVNEGTTWAPVLEDAPSGSTGAVTMAPGDPETVWVGLGESNILRSSMAGTGVYCSSDGGATWQHRGLADTGHIARIVIDPVDPQIVYVAACGHEYRDNPERGVYKTTNGGETWELVLYVSESTGAIDLVMAAKDPKTLYAATWNRIRRPWNDPVPQAGDGIYKSTDAGKTWVLLENGLPDSAKTGRTGLGISQSNPDIVYAVIDNHEQARSAEEGERDAYGRQRQSIIKGAEVYRSDDAGKSWRLMSSDDELIRSLHATYGWFFAQIRVDPVNPDKIFVMGVPLIQSTDGGKTFESCGYRGLHADHHAMWINPRNPDHVVSGNDGGINFSYDGGSTWKQVLNLPIIQFYNVEVDNARPFRVYGSVQDNHAWRGPSDYVAGRTPFWAWERIPGNEASTMAIDPQDENTFYSCGFYGRIQRSRLDTGETDSILPKVAAGEPPLRGQWLAPFILSPHNPQVIYHGMQYVFRSMDQGNTWQRISEDLTALDPEKQGNISYSTLFALSESPLRFGLLYAGTDDGRLHVTRDGGTVWKEITSLPKKWVSRVVASRYHEGTVFVTLNGKCDDDFQAYVYRSRDYGETWEDIGSIPGGPVNVIFEDPQYEGLLYLGTDMGIYCSMDEGDSWMVAGSALPITFVHDLALQQRDRVLVAATHGRGMWSMPLRTIYAEYRKLKGITASDDKKEEEAENKAERPAKGGEETEDEDKDDDK
jgi:photosystem II stability/assembly factor-like uncharacterized protein